MRDDTAVDMSDGPQLETPAHRSPLLEISNAMVGIHKRTFGRGPTKARTSVTGDLVVCLLEGGFTRAEETLAQSGHVDSVVQTRLRLHALAEEEMIATVEQIVGRTVRSVMSASRPDQDVQIEAFVLEADHG